MQQRWREIAEQALRNVGRRSDSVSLGLPPGAKARPWPDQAAQFVADVPDLLAQGPRWQEIEARHGPGEAQKYLETMTQRIAAGRQRRGPVP